MNSPQRRIAIETTPETTWGLSLYNLTAPEDWRRIRKTVLKASFYHCQACRAPSRWLQCDEQWSWNEETGVQTLIGLRALCRQCHLCKHIGLAKGLARQGKINLDDLIGHYCRVNNCDRAAFDTDDEQAALHYERRAAVKWSVDFGAWRDSLSMEKLKGLPTWALDRSADPNFSLRCDGTGKIWCHPDRSTRRYQMTKPTKSASLQLAVGTPGPHDGFFIILIHRSQVDDSWYAIVHAVRDGM